MCSYECEMGAYKRKSDYFVAPLVKSYAILGDDGLIWVEIGFVIISVIIAIMSLKVANNVWYAAKMVPKVAIIAWLSPKIGHISYEWAEIRL